MINKKGVMPFFTPTAFANELTTCLSPDSLPLPANADVRSGQPVLCRQWFWPLLVNAARREWIIQDAPSCLQASGRHRDAKHSIFGFRDPPDARLTSSGVGTAVHGRR